MKFIERKLEKAFTGLQHSPRFLVRQIGWSRKKPTCDQNQPKSLPTQTHGQTETLQQIDS